MQFKLMIFSIILLIIATSQGLVAAAQNPAFNGPGTQPIPNLSAPPTQYRPPAAQRSYAPSAYPPSAYPAQIPQYPNPSVSPPYPTHQSPQIQSYPIPSQHTGQPTQPVQPYTPQANIATDIQNVLIILDASQSMEEPLEMRAPAPFTLPGQQESKMVVAKRVILQTLQTLPPQVRVGLRVFGQEASPIGGMAASCQSTALLTPLGINNRAYIANQLMSIQPTGATPISLALKTSVMQDFINTPGPKMILLVTDGMESCDADPCDVAVSLLRSGVNVKINTVGLGLVGSDGAMAARQLQCVSATTYGRFYNAKTAAELAQSLTRALAVKTEVQAQIIPSGRPQAIPSQNRSNPQTTPRKILPPAEELDAQSIQQKPSVSAPTKPMRKPVAKKAVPSPSKIKKTVKK